jgi:polyisoprenoid-binding protein YceI
VIVGAAALALVVAAGAAVWYFVFRDDSPPAVAHDAAARAARAADRPSTMPTAGTTATGTLAGEWTVDTSIGKFADFTSTFAGYRVREELAGVGAKTAVGRTPKVSGTMSFDTTSLTKATVTVDMTTLVSDDSSRDGQMRRQGIESSRFPTASFTLTSPLALPALPPANTTVKLDAVGDLTLHGVTKRVTFPLEASQEGSVLVVTGSLDVQFADYSITRPQSFKVLSIEDHGVIELQLFLTRV